MTQDDEQVWLQKARDLAPLIEKHRDEGERERRLPAPIFEAMRDSGFFRMWMPKVYGGNETSLETLLSVGEEVAKQDVAAAWNLIIGVIGNFLLAYLPESTAREMIASNPDTYIAGAGNPTNATAVPTEGGYILSGTWPLASGCHQADWLFGGSFVLEEGKPRLAPGGRPEQCIFVFPRNKGEILDTWHSIGLRGTGSDHIRVESIFIPEDRCLSLTASSPVQPGPLYRGPILDGLGVLPVVSLGIARSAIEAFKELAVNKTPMMGRTRLAELHTTQERVGRAEMLLGAARAYVYEVAREIDAVQRAGGRVGPEVLAKRRLANYNAAQSAIQAVDLLYAIAGTSAIYHSSRLERCVRDARTVSQHLVAAPSNVEMVGQFLLTGEMAPRR
jgi:alkylation response protein AidB-like acyl-CoA dehydrogenase